MGSWEPREADARARVREGCSDSKAATGEVGEGLESALCFSKRELTVMSVS